MFCRLIRPLLAALLLLPVCGCASPEPATAPNASGFIATDRPITGITMYPALTAARQQTLRFTDEEGRLISEQAVPAEEAAGPAVRLERSEDASGDRARPDPIAAQTIAVGPDGAVVLIESTNAERGLTLQFDPPLIVAPTILQQDQPLVSHTTVREIDLSTGEATRPGTAEYRLELIGEDASSDPPLVLLRSRLEIRLGRSLVIRTTDRVYRVKNDSGLVLEHETATQVVSAMGFTVSRRQHSLRTVSE